MTITIKGKQFPGDFYDVDFMERYEAACMALQVRTQEINALRVAQDASRLSTADGYRALNRAVEEFFDMVFGPGSSAQIFQGVEGNVREHLEAVDEINGQAAEQRKGLNDITNRYTQRQAARAKPQAQIVQYPGAQAHGKGKRRHR